MSNFYISDGKRIKKYNVSVVDDEEIYITTPEWEEYKRGESLRLLLKKYSIPQKVADLSISDLIGMDGIKTRLNTFLQEFGERFSNFNLYFWSRENGHQKSTAAAILAKDLLAKGYSARYVLMGDLVRLLTKQGFDEEVDDKVEEYLNCDFLVIDDAFDAKKVTIYKSGYQIAFLDSFLRSRIEVMYKSTCFTSNIPISEVSTATFGVSLTKLIERSVYEPLEFTVPYAMRNDFDTDRGIW